VTAAPRARARCAAAAMLLLAAGATRAPAEPHRVAEARLRVHVVARGDTLSRIAARYGVSVHGLVVANGLRSERVVLRIGQRLVVPGATTAAAAHRPSAALVSAHAVEPAPRRPLARACCAPRDLILGLPDFLDNAPAFTWPVEGPVISTFRQRHSGWHRGIDIKAERGAAIYAAAAGLVVASDVERGFGRVVKLEHDGGFLTVYAHNEENLVVPGMRVAAGDPIATIGRSGRATTCHVHFEIHRDGAAYNPLYMLPQPPNLAQVEESTEPADEDP